MHGGGRDYRAGAHDCSAGLVARRHRKIVLGPVCVAVLAWLFCIVGDLFQTSFARLLSAFQGRGNLVRRQQVRELLEERIVEFRDEFHDSNQAVAGIADLKALLGRPESSDVPDALLQRCLRAAGGDAAEALPQAREIMRWRTARAVDEVLENPAAVAAERWYRKLLHYDVPGLDRRMRPIMIEAVGQWDMDAINRAAKHDLEKMLQAHIVVCETLLQLAQQASMEGALGNLRRVPGFVAVLDMKGLGLRHNPLVYPKVMSALREISNINARYYPGALEHLFVVNTPPLFASIWKVLSHVVLPSSGVKVDVLRKGDYSALVEACGRDTLPRQLGGRLSTDTAPYLYSA